jgi:hypothetical protein
MSGAYFPMSFPLLCWKNRELPQTTLASETNAKTSDLFAG